MNKYSEKLWNCVVRDQGTSMEIRLFRLISLMVSLLCIFFILPVNMLQDLSPYVNQIIAIYGLAAVYLYFRSCRGRHYIRSFYCLTILMLNVTWFLNGGSVGSFGYYFFAAVLYSLFFFRGLTRKAMFLLLVLDNCILLLVEHYYPFLVIPFNSANDRLFDLLSGLSFSIIASALVFWIVVTTLENELEERKRVEKALLESESKLWTILQSTGDGILAVDSDGKLLHTNHQLGQLWRIPQNLMECGNFQILLDIVLDQLTDPDAFLRKVQLLNNSEDIDTDTLDCKDGRVFERYSSPMITGGVIMGRVWSFRNITERKLAEEELQKRNTEIEQFIYTVSHDLRSPLVTVKTFLGYLENDIAESNQERLSQDLRFIHTAADKMKLLLDELLEMSRIGRIEAPPVRVSLLEVVEEVLGGLAGPISERKADIHLPDTNPMLFGDRPRLCQIWQNLVENAIKYSHDSSTPQIELGLQQVNGEMVFFVKDNGIGINPRYHSIIFGIFDKLDPKSPGAGLGLSMVQRIVEKYGGRVWVESEGTGRGSCFFFTLPQAVVQS